MRVKYFAHSSFLITTDSGVRIITDPYESGGFGGEVRYKPIREECDVVLISHEHMDHNYTSDIQGTPAIIRKLGEFNVSDITFKGIASYHDETHGSQRGRNTIFTFRVDGIQVCHLGDLGHPITQELKAQIGTPDVLFVPVGGVFTIDADGASRVVESLGPKIVIPMHYKTRGVGFPLSGVDEFTRGKSNVKDIDNPEAGIVLPEQPQIWVFTPVLL